jgi:hypothetical protein
MSKLVYARTACLPVSNSGLDALMLLGPMSALRRLLFSMPSWSQNYSIIRSNLMICFTVLFVLTCSVFSLGLPDWRLCL